MPIFNNTATLSYNGNVITSNTVTGNLVSVLSMTKTAVNNSYTPGQVITYVISLINSGTAGYSGLTVTDDLGAYTGLGVERYPLTYIPDSVIYYQNGIVQGGVNVVSQSPLVISGINVPAGGNSLLIYQATVNGYAPLALDSTITNRATVTGQNLSDVSASETISVENGVSLSITKSLSPTTVTENSRLTYTFVIRNQGNRESAATDNIILTDAFDPVLNDISVEINGATADPSRYSYDSQTGVFTTANGAITVPAATFTVDPVTGEYVTEPGVVIITVEGTV